tara:strand:- start:1807 stop:1983 length:177 start_codon:yes stop_codon:yes gene_type:complete
MTKKDYIKIASIIKDNSVSDDKLIRYIAKDPLIKDFVIMFKKDNERFDKERFIKACFD